MSCLCKPVRWAQLSKIQKDTFGNGCGPNWLPNALRKFVTVYFFGWLFHADCQRHDFGYARGGSADDKKWVDKGFYRAMKSDAKSLKKRWQRYLALAVAFAYYILVKYLGWMRFGYGPYRTLVDLTE